MARRRMQPRFFLFLAAVIGVGAGIFLLVRSLTSPSQEALLAATPTPAGLEPTASPQLTPKPALPDNVTVVRSAEADPSKLGMES